ncbi:chromosome segregation protein SMC [Corynebacterium anserum]|uniref:Chromosome partition protein Smc n=1 Tax=Corynebacterium anserum TaxID=2684406 RepID=A0A7G7YNX6_9CORY|nr:chromosome segregation protein SMC [Corynebacterium anserum]MBC2681795.1 chromosome segregation protein SMC [Corynebacterium anserum]QNH96196.1 chromosome segregation protein SMC [Corynebacterium anserum]
MHLKSLTLKGFKSFASSTTLKLEPGICAVVGPNGSGKSNVVDALAWVMGEHSAKTLRGGKMEDVIFAGAGDRKPLGRAEVTLTIDNSDGALPIEYSEVSVTRRMFRDGASEYEINGAKARLMDVQELLSDSGIGREMHVIVGQGRLAQILESKPEERRAFIEEAAGVLKHRRRKEKAQRKLVSMQANLDRLHDLTDELHKQLGPLARQADAAQKASTVQATIRNAKVQLAAHQVRTLSEELNSASGRAELVAEQVEELQELVEDHSSRLANTEEELRTALENAEAARTLWYRLSSVSEKNSATIRIAADRAEQSPEARWGGQDPEELLARADRAEQEQRELDDAVEIAAEKLEAIQEEVAEREEAARQAEREHFAQVRAIADRREGIVRLLSQHESALQRQHSIQSEVERLKESVEQQQEAVDSAAEETEIAREAVNNAENSGGDLQADLERANREAYTSEQRAEELRARQLVLEKEISTLEATMNAWEAHMRPVDGAAVVNRTVREVGGTTRTLAEVVTPHDGWATAFSAALGEASDGLVVAGEGDNLSLCDAIIHSLSAADEGRAVVVTSQPKKGWRLDASPKRGQWLLDLLDCPQELDGTLSALLVDVVAVDTVADARSVVKDDARLRAVTRDGVLVGTGWAAAGNGGSTAVELVEKTQAARHDVETKTAELSDLQAALDGALDAASERRTAAAAARAAMQAHKATLDSAQRHAQATAKNFDAVSRQLQRVSAQLEEATLRLSQAESDVAELADRVARIDDEGEEKEPSTQHKDAATLALSQVKAVEMDARLALRTAEERATATRGRADSLRRQARQEEAARAQFDKAQARRRREQKIAASVLEQARRVGRRIDDALARAEENRSTTDAAHKQWQVTMSQQREKLSALTAQLGRLTDSSHHAELARSQAQLKIEQALDNAMEQLGLNAEQLLEEQLPEDFDEKTTRAELKKAQKALNSLGKVNPLALEEYKALEERYSFLSQQLDDVERARADLHDVIADVDNTILTLFTEAWKDVETEFPKVFSTLFPGGAGRLVLTDPSDMLTTGIEVEARPPGKKVKRLTLLSGGEKSLTALAMLVAIFRARPSPFYVMDEVEAALDDVNLRRLIALLEELRRDSQLIVITHQKPTMDVANVLYGVTMRGDGVTRVISQRMSPAGG